MTSAVNNELVGIANIDKSQFSTANCMTLLKDKVVIITGSAGGLGRVVTKLFLENGAKIVALCHRRKSEEELQNYVGELGTNLTTVIGDATKEDEVIGLTEKALEGHGRIDALLNIVGGYAGGELIHDIDEEIWDGMINLNMKTTFMCSKSVLPHMLEQSYGRIINVSSRTGVEKGRRVKSGAYAVAKAGVLTLTEVLAEETKGKGVTVNCIAPSIIDTPANREGFPKADFSKWVAPEEIANVMLFLASDDSMPTSGALVPVYGAA